MATFFTLVIHKKMQQLTVGGILDLMECKLFGSGDRNFLELARGLFFFFPPIFGFLFSNIYSIFLV